MIMARGSPQDIKRSNISHLGREIRHVSMIEKEINDVVFKATGTPKKQSIRDARKPHIFILARLQDVYGF